MYKNDITQYGTYAKHLTHYKLYVTNFVKLVDLCNIIKSKATGKKQWYKSATTLKHGNQY